MKPRKVIKFLRCDLTAEEHRQAALNLARANEAMAAIEEEKKVATSQFAERIAQAKASIGKFSRIISNGYEMRNVECQVLYHTGYEESGPDASIGYVIVKEVPQVKLILRPDLLRAGDWKPGDPNPSAYWHWPKVAIVAVEAMTEAELQESFDFDQKLNPPAAPSAPDLDAAAQDYPHGAPTSTPLPACSKCGKEPVGAEGGVCDSCQADQKVNGKRGKKTGKGPQESAARAVSTPADQQPGEEF